MELRLSNGWTNGGWLFDQMNGLFTDLMAAHEDHVRPPVDVVEDGDGYHFYFEMPGVRADSIDASIKDGTLVVKAERKRPEWSKEARVHRAERDYGWLRRSFRLSPEMVAREGIRAAYRDGVLEVTLPKPAQAKPVKIQVN